MDGLAIAASLTEMRPVINGAIIQRIYQPEPGTFVLHLFAGKEIRMLVSPREAVIHLTQLDLCYPKSPSPFVMLLRKYLRGGQATGIRQQGWERVVTLEVKRRRPQGMEPTLLIAELLGIRGNLILVQADRVIAALRPDPRVVSGSPYTPLPGQEKLNPERITASQLAEILPERDAERALVRQVDGIGRQTARAVLARAEAQAHGTFEERLFQALLFILSRVKDPQPQYDTMAQWASFFPLVPPGERCDSLAAALDREYSDRQSTRVDKGWEALRPGLSRGIARHKRTLARLGEWLTKADSEATLRYHADLLMIHQHGLSRGISATTLIDPASGESIKIPLNPRLGPVENAQALYERAKRLRRGRPIVKKRSKRLKQELAHLEEGLTAVEEERPPSEEALALIRVPPSPKGSPPAMAPRVFKIHGYTIEVGKDATQNDVLLRKAHPEDLWLHAKGIPGSHVIIHRQGRSKIPQHVINEAARLAARYSKAKGEDRVRVSTALVKHVRRPKGAPPGLVILTQEDTLTVEPAGKGNMR